MNDPIRLFEEAPTSDLSLALDAERELAAALNGAALKGRLLANVAAGAVPSALSVTASTWASTALPMILAGVVGVGVGVGGTLLVVDRKAATPPAIESQLVRDDVRAAIPPAVPAPEPARPTEPTESTEPARAAPRPPSDSKAERSSLIDETRRYDRAEAALRDGRTSVAVDELRDYLRVYPNGSLRDEARLSLLEAYFQAQRFADARDLAKGLADDARLHDRRREISRVLVQSHLKLHECEQAARAAEALGDETPATQEAIARCQKEGSSSR